MEKEEREVRERKGRSGRRGEGEKGGNGSGPDQVREEIDARVHTPTVYYFEYKNNKLIASC